HRLQTEALGDGAGFGFESDDKADGWIGHVPPETVTSPQANPVPLHSAAARGNRRQREKATRPGGPSRLLVPRRGYRRGVSFQAILVTFSAAGPLLPWTTSNSTRSPSARLLKPEPWIAEGWTKQS